MLTAERLFAERGIHGVSMREVGMAANQRNNNVIAYHFGDRRGLIRAIYALRSEQLNRRRHELLDILDDAGQGSELPALLTALVQPQAETIEDPDNHFLGMLARMLLDEGSIAGEGASSAAPHMSAHHEIRERVASHIPGASDDRFLRRFDLLLNFAITAFAAQKIGSRPKNSVPQLLTEVVSTMVASLEALALESPEVRRPRPKRSRATGHQNIA
jgi:AcrR family transcriptional regulator